MYLMSSVCIYSRGSSKDKEETGVSTASIQETWSCTDPNELNGSFVYFFFFNVHLNKLSRGFLPKEINPVQLGKASI